MLKSGIARTWGRLISSSWRNIHTNFHIICTGLQFRQQPMNKYSLFSTYLLVWADISFPDLGHSNCDKWNLKVDLIFIFLLAKNVEYFMCFSGSSVLYFDNTLLSFIPHFIIRIFFLIVQFLNSFYVLNTNIPCMSNWQRFCTIL